jgi:DNA-binding protein HU-beta
LPKNKNQFRIFENGAKQILLHQKYSSIMSTTKPVPNVKLSKSDLVAKLATVLGISKVQSEKNLNATLEAIVNMVVEGNDVKLTGFGTFYKAERKARDGVNPKTKAKIKIAAYKTAGFKVGKNFKDAVKASK